MKKLASSVFEWLIRFLYIQFFITLASLPILINWGLPLSLMSPVANLVFSPFLMAFLLLSSLIFFFELFCVPNLWLVYLLEKTVDWWLYFLNLSSPSWLISFANPSALFFILFLGTTFFVLHAKKFQKPLHSVCAFSCIFFLSFSYLKLQSSTMSNDQVECNKGAVTILRKNNQTILIDHGILGQRASSDSWIDYSLMPHLNKKFGTSALEHLIIMQPSTLTFEAAANLCNKTIIKNIYLVTWDGKANRSFYRNYWLLKKAVEEKNIKWHRIGKREVKLHFNDQSIINISPLDKQLRYQEATFPALHVHTVLDNEEINIYSAKMKRHSNTLL